MQRESPTSGAKRRTVVASGRVAAAILLSALAGCAARRPEPRAVPRPDSGLALGAATAEPAPAPVEATRALADPAEPATWTTPALSPDPAELPSGDDELLAATLVESEPITDSPLDQLAVLEPSISERDAAEGRDLVETAPPTFDIPIELNERVLAWVELYSGRMRDSFEAGLERSGRYLERFRRIFAEAGLPQDLVYMAHVESGYKPTAYSRAHARGIFQFMAATARRYGLRVDYWVDERADPDRSAEAAAAYMRDLHDEFGDWYLALAAYNAGEGKIRRALARSGKKDFWGIARTRYINRETKNHVPAILAATLLSKEPVKYGLRHAPEAALGYDTIEVAGAADLRILADCADSDLDTLRQLNPALRRLQTPPDGSTRVHVPEGRGPSTLAALSEIPRSERVLYARHEVRPGDTLSGLARQYAVSVRAIQDTNGMGRRTLIRVGHVLRIPTSAASRYPEAPSHFDGDGTAGVLVTYRVRRGDTLYRIAREHGTTPAAIAAASGIAVDKTLQIGESLTVVRGARSAQDVRRRAAGAAPQAASSTPAVHDPVIHTVRRGDTLWRIASLYDTSVRALCALNRLAPNQIIHPGTRLTVGFR